MKNFREIEQLSAYLDGQLNTSELARMETRLTSDPELDSVLSDLRAARGILQKLPKRKAPRNFTLTRQMVGLKPPLPRSYPVFRFATVFASLMLMLSLSVNALSPYVSFNLGNSMYGFGMGGGGGEEMAVGGGCEGPCEEAAAAPAAESAPMLELAPSMEEEGAAQEPQMDSAMDQKQAGAQEQPSPEEEAARSVPPSEAPIPVLWLAVLLIVSILGGGWMWLMQRSAAKKWQ
jgi:anti-sigma factor RsiW